MTGPRRRPLGARLAALLFLASFVGAISGLASRQVVADPSTTVEPRATQNDTPTNGHRGANFAKTLSQAFHNAAEQVLPAVVTITTTPAAPSETSKDQPSMDNDDNNPFEGTPFGDMFGDNPDLRQFFHKMPTPRHRAVEMGSGVVIDPSGIILTNNHVVEMGGTVTVRLPDGSEYTAKDIKTDPKTDLAVLRIEGASSLKAAKLGDSDALDVGDWVLALGQPFGLEGTVTAGIISAKGRGLGLTARDNFLQTDAAINPGNSGGPLVNLDGEVIGINTAISTQSGGYQGVGFAIPVNLAKWVSKQLIEGGKVRRAYLGVSIQPITQQMADQFGVKVHEGALVTDVPHETPAEKAGIKPGDIIVEFAGKKIPGPQELQGAVEESKLGAAQSIVVIRDGKKSSLSISPGEQPADYGLRGRSRGPIGKAPETSQFDKLGIQAENLTPEVAKKLGVRATYGVAITQVRQNSLADRAGLSSGSVIVQANRKPVKTVDDLRAALDQQSLDKGLLLLVQSVEGSRFVVIRAQ